MFISKEELNRRLSNSGPDRINSKTTTPNTPQQNTITSNSNTTTPRTPRTPNHTTTNTTPNPSTTNKTPNTTLQNCATGAPQQSNPITSCISSLLDKDKFQTGSNVKSGLDRKRNLNSLTDEALEKTLQALGMITPDKLIGLSAEKLSRIACNTSKIIDNCREDKDIPPGINITIYSPEQKSESSYKVIDVAR